ncbi:class 3 lipase, partial [Strigomonas culicis]
MAEEDPSTAPAVRMDEVIGSFRYTHSQPQWRDALRCDGAVAIVRRGRLAPQRVCATCAFAKEGCACRRCGVCGGGVRRGTRHHCRQCWRPVCGGCWTKRRYVHMLGPPLRVCSRCAVPWALANLCKREERGLLWGLYALRRAGEMPCLCIAPGCATLTYNARCDACGLPTVMTQPHVERLVRAGGATPAQLDQVRLLDGLQLSLRTAAAAAYGDAEVERTFRGCFKHYEEADAFRGVAGTREAQHILLSMVAAATAYEYGSAPSISLALSDVPYARLLRMHSSQPRYTIMEAPGRVKFIAFAGTHNWRTRWVDLHFAQTTLTEWRDVVEATTCGGDGGAPLPVHGGVRKVWEYKVHR